MLSRYARFSWSTASDRDLKDDGRPHVPKKLLLVLAAVAGGLLFARKRRNARAESDLWHEATSSTDLR